jgi:hypothetical protein
MISRSMMTQFKRSLKESRKSLRRVETHTPTRHTKTSQVSAPQQSVAMASDEGAKRLMGLFVNDMRHTRVLASTVSLQEAGEFALNLLDIGTATGAVHLSSCVRRSECNVCRRSVCDNRRLTCIAAGNLQVAVSLYPGRSFRVTSTSALRTRTLQLLSSPKNH